MTATVRPYNRAEDYDRIGQFLIDTYRAQGGPGNWLQARWEYMHFHPEFDESSHHRIGVWEDNGRGPGRAAIVAVANYEMTLGEAFFQVHADYGHLKEEMLDHAERHLCAPTDDGRGYLRAYIADSDAEFEAIVRRRGYRKHEEHAQPDSHFRIPRPFPEITLPAGFRLRSLDDDNDLRKVDRVLWRGFNHPGEPQYDPEGRALMQSAPNYRKDLNIVVQAPNGDFAAYCGMWYLPAHRLGYVEPVAADPDYRRMGLGRTAVLEGIRRCGELGATVAVAGSSQEFYLSFGFAVVSNLYPWTTRLQPAAAS